MTHSGCRRRALCGSAESGQTLGPCQARPAIVEKPILPSARAGPLGRRCARPGQVPRYLQYVIEADAGGDKQTNTCSGGRFLIGRPRHSLVEEAAVVGWGWAANNGC